MRTEIKYLVPNDRLPALRAAISPMMQLDKYCTGYEERGYTVRSIYLDTPRLRCYHEKIEGLKQRKKLRIRGYNHPDIARPVFLEIKHKTESKIEKERTAVPYDRLQDLFRSRDAVAYLTELHPEREPDASATHFFYHVKRAGLQPINLVVYEREAFEGKIDPSLRITLDRNLRGALFPTLDTLYAEEDLIEVMPDHFILEIKYNSGFPFWMTSILSRFGLQKQALSKYVLCLDHSAERHRVSLTSSVRYLLNPLHAALSEPSHPAGVSDTIHIR